MKYAIPINQYNIDLQKEIDDAEWLGDFDRADFVKEELEDVKRMIDNGELWYPTHELRRETNDYDSRRNISEPN